MSKWRWPPLAPWLALAPGQAIFGSVLALNLLGDALRSALDPRLSRPRLRLREEQLAAAVLLAAWH